MKNLLKVVILDDEPKAVESLKWELTTFCSNVEIVATFTNPLEAQPYLKQHDVDCIFLDIEMPQMDGFRFLDELPPEDLEVEGAGEKCQVHNQKKGNATLDSLKSLFD